MRDDKVPADIKSDVEAKIQAVRSALTGTDVQAVQRAAQELGEAIQRIGQAVYQQSAAGGPAPGGPGTGSPGAPGGRDEGTVEGEFREV